MSIRENEEREGASPTDDLTHRSPHQRALYATDPAFQFFRQRHALPDPQMKFADDDTPAEKTQSNEDIDPLVTDQARHGTSGNTSPETVAMEEKEPAASDLGRDDDVPLSKESSKPISSETEALRRDESREMDTPDPEDMTGSTDRQSSREEAGASHLRQDAADTVTPVSDFTRWLSGLKQPSPQTGDPTGPPKGEAIPKSEETEPDRSNEKAKKQNKKRKKKKKAKKSKAGKKGAKKTSGVMLHEDIFSETLAELLAAQGHVDKAIEMYERLRLKYPEKSRLFAAKIDDLKQSK